MKIQGYFAAFAVILLTACGQGRTDPANLVTNADKNGQVSHTPGTGAAEAALTAGGVAEAIAGAWRCKAQGDIPIGLLDVAPGGAYTFTVVKNTVWEPKANDSGNGKGTLGAPDGQMKPLNGPLVDAYEIIGIARAESEWGVRIYLNNDYGSLMHCGLASEEG